MLSVNRHVFLPPTRTLFSAYILTNRAGYDSARELEMLMGDERIVTGKSNQPGDCRC